MGSLRKEVEGVCEKPRVRILIERDQAIPIPKGALGTIFITITSPETFQLIYECYIWKANIIYTNRQGSSTTYMGNFTNIHSAIDRIKQAYSDLLARDGTTVKIYWSRK